ncbi:MAG: shikimate dehydrogenase [Actinomycetota bacterium]|nr:shikimate dehydrogenase [Actinomycetota bacterium]
MTPAVRHRAAVLGSPVAHSLSPALHRAAYRTLGLDDWTYDSFDVDGASLPGFLDSLGEEWAGLSLTMPLKATVLPLLDTVAPLARGVGAVNTVVLRWDGRRLVRHGENTDVSGLAGTVRARMGAAPTATVLGAGATARSAVAALGTLGAHVVVVARSPGRARELSAVGEALGVSLEVRPWQEPGDAFGAPVVVNTTPPGAADLLEAPAGPGLLVDVVYAPWPTRLANAWSAAGGTVVGGVELLARQAAGQLQLMTGQALDEASLVPLLLSVGEQALEAARRSERPDPPR